MQSIKQTRTKKNLNTLFKMQGITLLQLMLVLMTAGIMGALAIHVIRYYTIH